MTFSWRWDQLHFQGNLARLIITWMTLSHIQKPLRKDSMLSANKESALSLSIFCLVVFSRLEWYENVAFVCWEAKWKESRRQEMRETEQGLDCFPLSMYYNSFLSVPTLYFTHLKWSEPINIYNLFVLHHNKQLPIQQPCCTKRNWIFNPLQPELLRLFSKP